MAQLAKELLRAWLKVGRWTNESEIGRHGIERVRREVERDRLSKYPDGVLARCYKQMQRDELAEDAAWGEASLKAQKIRCDFIGVARKSDLKNRRGRVTAERWRGLGQKRVGATQS